MPPSALPALDRPERRRSPTVSPNIHRRLSECQLRPRESGGDAAPFGGVPRRRWTPCIRRDRRLAPAMQCALIRPILKPPSIRPIRSHPRSEEHTSELQSLMRISYAVFCLKKKNKTQYNTQHNQQRTTIK